MEIPQPDRFAFIQKITRGQRARYRITHRGDRFRQDRLKRRLPIAYAVHCQQDRQDRKPS